MPSSQDSALHCGGPGPVPGPGTEAPKPRGRAWTRTFMNRSTEGQLIHNAGSLAHGAVNRVYTSRCFHHYGVLHNALWARMLHVTLRAGRRLAPSGLCSKAFGTPSADAQGASCLGCCKQHCSEHGGARGPLTRSSAWIHAQERRTAGSYGNSVF